MDSEIFISYAHADDTPRQPDDDKGWITALRDAIVEDHKKYSTEPLRIFFDTEAIESMDHWERKIREGLRHSSILLVCLSPKYFQSEYCRKEWEEYQARQVHRLAGMDSIAPVYFVAAPDADAQDIRRWKEAVQRSQYVDLQEWYPKGLRALREEAVRKKLDGLGASLWQRIQRARRAAKAPGNMRSCNVHFVGRRREVCNLHESLATGAIGVVTAVHGLGGVGKTELAVAYAHGYADSYPGGLWSLNAEGKKELLPLFAELAKTPEMPMELDPNLTEEQVGQRVLAWLKKRAEAARDADSDKGAACLVLLDNVSEPELLSQSQLIHLPRERFDWLRVVATTRLGRDDFHAPSGKALGFVPVDALEEEDALVLLREHQEGEKWPYPEDEAAAREIVRELGGFALAIEQAAIHLGLKRDLRPGVYLDRLRREGLQSVDALGSCPEVAREMLHREKQFAVIMAETWEELSDVERAALEYAALLPPESVIWPILRHVVGRDFPDALAYDAQQDDVDPWAACRRRLEGRRLITPGEYQEVGRLHRLAGECVRERLGDKAPGMRQALHEAVSEAALLLEEAYLVGLEKLWWLRPLQEAVGYWWPRYQDTRLANASVCLGGIENTFGLMKRAFVYIVRGYEVLIREYHANPNSDDAAKSYARAGLIYADWFLTRCLSGDREKALGLLQESLEIRRKLLAANPCSAKAATDVSVSLIRLADWHLDRCQPGNRDKALGMMQEALQICRPIFEASQDSSEVILVMILILSRLADWHFNNSQPGGRENAWKLSQELLQGSRRVLTANPKSPVAAQAVANSLNRLARCHLERGQDGDRDAALGYFQESLTIRQKLFADNPDSAQAARDMSVSLKYLADWHLGRGQAGDWDTALGYLQGSLMITRKLYADNPDSAQAARDVAISLVALANYYHTHDESVDVKTILIVAQEALEIIRNLYTESEDSAIAARDMCSILNIIIWCHLTRNKDDDAMIALRYSNELVHIAQCLHDGYPNVEEHAENYIQALKVLSDATKVNGNKFESFKFHVFICSELNRFNQKRMRFADKYLKNYFEMFLGRIILTVGALLLLGGLVWGGILLAKHSF